MFTDISEEIFAKDAITAINFVSSAGILEGYADGSFQPANLITNAELCRALYYTFHSFCDEKKLIALSQVFSDHWAHTYLNFIAAFPTSNVLEHQSDIFDLSSKPDDFASITLALKMIKLFFDALIPNCPKYPYLSDKNEKYIPDERKGAKITRLTFAKTIYWFATQFVNTITFNSGCKVTVDDLFVHWETSPINPFKFALHLQIYAQSLFSNAKDISFFNLFTYIDDDSFDNSRKWYSIIIDLNQEIENVFLPPKKKSFFQYTSLSALYKMLTQSNQAVANDPPKIQLHLSNAAYLNDPDEGSLYNKTLTSTLKKFNLQQRYEQLFNSSSIAIPYSSSLIQTNNTYIVSFSQVEKERLPMWVQYANNAQGCRIEFDIQSLQCYSIKYNAPSRSLPKVMKDLISIAADPSFSKIQDYILSKLHELQYYYKNKYYQHEDEVRYAITTSLSNATTEEAPRDGEYFPRLYYNIPTPLTIKSVTLGPKCPNPEHVALYLKKMNVPAIYRSEIHYR